MSEHEDNIKKEFAAAEGISVEATETPNKVIQDLGKVVTQQQKNTNSTTMPTTIGKHILLTSKDKKTRCCHLCKIMEKTQKKRLRRTIYSCQQCKTAFCVDCFAAYHNMDELHKYRSDIAKKIKENEEDINIQKKVRFRQINCMSTLEDIKFNFEL